MTETRRIYIKGKFRGNYEGIPSGMNPVLHTSYFDVKLTGAEVVSAETVAPYDRRFLTYEPYYEIKRIPDATVRLLENEQEGLPVCFHEDLHDVILNDITIRDPQSFGSNNYGILEGTIHATLLYTRTTAKQNTTPAEAGPAAFTPRLTTPINDRLRTEPPMVPEDRIHALSEGWSNNSRYLLRTSLIYFFILAFMVLWKGFSPAVLGAGFLIILNLISLFTTNLSIGTTETGIQPPTWKERRYRAGQYHGSALLYLLMMAFSWLLGVKSIAIVFFILYFLVSSATGSFVLKVFRRLFIGVLLTGLLVIVALYVSSRWHTAPSAEDTRGPVKIEVKKDSTGKVTHFDYNLVWKDYDGKQHSGHLTVAADTFRLSNSNRNGLFAAASLPEVYPPLATYDSPLVASMYSMFDSLRLAERPDPRRFAEIMVSCVQQIPYVLVHERSCEEFVRENSSNSFVVDYHRSDKECLSDCRFGLQAPAEFSFNLKGDCDTRVLLLYTLLTRFGYQPAVLISEAYGHSVLGIADPFFNGLNKYHSGRPYYLWETTAPGWRPGTLPPQVGNPENWNIALIN